MANNNFSQNSDFYTKNNSTDIFINNQYDYSVNDQNHIYQVLTDNNFQVIKQIREGGYGKIILIKDRLENINYVAKVVNLQSY